MKSSLIFALSILLALDLALGASLLKMPGALGREAGLELYLLDVGQGDAVLLRTPEGHNVLVDGGPGNAVLTELAETLPYLFSEIDLLVLTHPHADHLEGLVPVLERFQVNAVLLSAPEYGSLAYDYFLWQVEELSAGGTRVFFADDGTDFRLGEVILDVLYPFEPLTELEMENVNNASPVIMISWGNWEEAGNGGGRILLTGDAEVEVEEALLEKWLAGEVDLRADILKAGHHGSRTASSLEFLEAVGPEVLVISVGEGNSFEHPHQETLENANSLGIEVRRTDLDGRVLEEFD